MKISIYFFRITCTDEPDTMICFIKRSIKNDKIKSIKKNITFLLITI